MAVGVTAVLVACAGGGGGRNASGGNASVVITNNSAETIYRIFMSPSSQTTWGPDQLGNNVLSKGGSFTLTVTPGTWDIKVQDRTGNTKQFRNQNLRGGHTYTLEVDSQNWTAPGN